MAHPDWPAPEPDPRTYAQLNLSYQELLRPGLGPRIFDNKSVGLTLARRDPITPQLTLDTSYQVQYNDARSRSLTSSGAIITDFSRVTHTLNAYLGYTPSNRWHTGLNYQLTILDYTVQNRYDTVQQILAQVVYSITPACGLASTAAGALAGRPIRAFATTTPSSALALIPPCRCFSPGIAQTAGKPKPTGIAQTL